MKVITLVQPWATLIVIGAKYTFAKKIETRSWYTKYRGQLGIHAGQKVDRKAMDDPYIRRALEKAGYTRISQLPRGQIIGTAELVDCSKIKVNESGIVTVKDKIVGYPEKAFGDFRNGRFAWQTENAKELENPIHVRGQLGLWDYRGALW